MKRFVACVALAVSLCGCSSTIDTGFRGVTLQWGAPTGEVKPEGFYWYAPFSGISIVPMNVQIQSGETQAAAVSRDLQKIDTKLTINYHLDPGKVVSVYDQLREDYATRVIDPSIQETVKAVTARFTAGDLIGHRDQVVQQTEAGLRRLIEPYGIHVDQVMITDFQFSKNFAEAVEAKVTAQQELVTVRTQAQAAIEKAQGEARAQFLQRQTLTPLMVQLRWIDKWNGQLPNVTGGGTPFINMPAAAPEKGQ